MIIITGTNQRTVDAVKKIFKETVKNATEEEENYFEYFNKYIKDPNITLTINILEGACELMFDDDKNIYFYKTEYDTYESITWLMFYRLFRNAINQMTGKIKYSPSDNILSRERACNEFATSIMKSNYDFSWRKAIKGIKI